MRKKIGTLSQSDVHKLAKKADSWVASAKGRKVLEKALQNSEKTVEKLSEDRFVDPQSLRTPLNI